MNSKRLPHALPIPGTTWIFLIFLLPGGYSAPLKCVGDIQFLKFGCQCHIVCNLHL